MPSLGLLYICAAVVTFVAVAHWYPFTYRGARWGGAFAAVAALVWPLTAFLALSVCVSYLSNIAVRTIGPQDQPMNENEYTCAFCHGTFEKGWTEQEALAEASSIWGQQPSTHDMAVVCDDCYKRMTTAFSPTDLINSHPTEH